MGYNILHGHAEYSIGPRVSFNSQGDKKYFSKAWLRDLEKLLLETCPGEEALRMTAESSSWPP